MIELLITRWRTDLKEMFAGIAKEPFGGERWEKDFLGTEIDKPDIHYAIFLGVITMIPAAMIVFMSPLPQWKSLALFFGAPLQAVISGFLTSSLLFLGSYVNKTPTTYTIAFKLMLRIMSVFPLLRFFSIHPFLMALSTAIYGFFVVRGAIKTFQITTRNALLFFGVIYLVFTLLQISASFG